MIKLSNAPKAVKDAEGNAIVQSVTFSTNDRGDGTYELQWKCDTAGTYPIDVLMSGAHVSGSPIQLITHPAKPAVEKMEASGSGRSMAIAGIKAKLNVRVAGAATGIR